MFSRHISRYVAAHVDGELAGQRARRVELHLTRCERCRAEREQVRFAMAILDHLPSADAPDTIWTSIEAALPRYRPTNTEPFRRWRLGFATLAVMAVASAAYWMAIPRSERWEVAQVRGAPEIDSKPVRGVAHIGAGDWIETDESSSATMKVGDIGLVDIAPNTRVRVVTARPGEHRLALARGEIHARISAPPRLFFVDTPSGTAVDLGCEYSLHTEEDGFGWLQVTRGWVAFQFQGLESLVPAGASCRTRPDAGPGVPSFDDAPENFKQALETFTTEKSGDGSLNTILSEARVRDTFTLWHLLLRVDLRDRERIFDRMAVLTRLPAGVSRENVLKLDRDTLTRWKDELAWTW